MSPTVIAGLEAIYARVPKMECQGKCQDCCGPIAMSPHEFNLLCEYSGSVPQTIPIADRKAVMLVTGACLTCPFLNQHNGQCEVYEVRPMICRLWGVDETMPCPFGCKPERPFSKKEAYKLLDAIEALKDQ